MKRTIILLLVFVLVFTTLLAGCGSKSSDIANSESPNNVANEPDDQKSDDQNADDQEADANDAPSGAVELSFWTFQELHKGFMDDAVERWNEANPDRPISLLVDVFPYDEMHNKLLISLQSGTGAPDIADIEIGKFANFLKGSEPSLVPLNRVLEPELDKFVLGRLTTYSKDGKYYGLDYHVGASVMFYNMEILEEAGVNPDDIKTWDDYFEYGKQVVEKTGKPMGTVETTEHWTFYPMINQRGSDFLDENGDVILDNEINIETLEFIKKMLDEGVVQAAPGGFHHAEEYWAFMNEGGAASVLMPMWYMGRFTQYMPDLKGKMVIRPMPAWEEGGMRSAVMGGTGTAVTNQAKDIDLAVDFLGFAKASKEGAIKTWTILGFDPIRWDVWDAPEMSADNEYTEYFGKDIFDMLKSIKDEMNPVNVGDRYPAAVSLVQKEVMFKVLEEQSMTPEEALKAAAEELRAQ